jgi:predicted Zn-dependent protease
MSARRSLTLWLCVCSCAQFGATPGADLSLFAQETNQTQPQQELDIKRYESILLQAPKKGTALDKVYEYHVQRADLDNYLKRLASNTDSSSASSANVMAAIGLLESCRGRELPAIDWLRKAESLSPQNPLFNFYIAQSQLFAGQTAESIASFEQALSKGPNRTDRIHIEESLGQLYLRTQQRDKANEVWQRLEAAFPKDAYIQERIAQINQAEGGIDNLREASVRYERLARSTVDASRKLDYETKVAALMAQIGKKEQAIASYEAIMSQLKPGSWRYKEMRRRIESIYLSTNDQDGWIRYLQNWLEKNSDDFDSRIRLAQALYYVRKPELAEKTLHDAIARAPSNIELRLALVQIYQSNNRWGKAALEMEQLVAKEPNNLDYRMQWGEMVYRDSAVVEGIESKRIKTSPAIQKSNREKAIAIWNSLPPDKAEDVPSLRRVADALSSIQAWEPAISLLQRAHTKTPDDIGLIEEIGELQFKLGDREAAITTWKSMVVPPHNANLQKRYLVDVFRRYELNEEAIAVLQKVLSKDLADDSSSATSSTEMVGDSMTAAELYAALNRTTEAVQSVRQALKFVDVDSADVYFSSLNRLLQTDFGSQHLVELAEKAFDASSSSIEQLTAAKILANAGKQDMAIAFVDRIVSQTSEGSKLKTLELTLALEFYREANQFSKAIEICRRLGSASADSRPHWIMLMAQLYLKSGAPTKAVDTARAILELSNATRNDYNECAVVCTLANRIEDAIEIWNHAVRKNPKDRRSFMQIAEQSSKLGRNDESIVAYWKAFELSEDLPSQKEVIRKLAPLYLKKQRMDELIAKLGNAAREKESERLNSLWSSVAYQSVRNYRQARAALEPLVQSDSQDPSVVELITSLAEANGDFAATISWQKRLVQMVPSEVNQLTLGKLLNSAGDRQGACKDYLELVRAAKRPEIRNTAMEYLYLGSHTPEAIAFCQQVAKTGNPSWEIQGIAMYLLLDNEKTKEAAAIANRIIGQSEPSTPDFVSAIPTVIQKGNYTTWQSGANNSDFMHELSAATSMVVRLSTPNSSQSTFVGQSSWGPVRNYPSLRGAAKAMVYYWLSAEERSSSRLQYQTKLLSGAITNRQLMDAMIFEIAVSDYSSDGSIGFDSTGQESLKSPEFRTLAKEFLKRGHCEGAELYLISNVGNRSGRNIDIEDLELAVDVMKRGLSDPGSQHFGLTTTVLNALSKSGRAKDVEDILEALQDSRDGSLQNALKSFCLSQSNSELLLKYGKRQLDFLTGNPLNTSAYYLPSFASECFSSRSDHAKVPGDLLLFYLDRQAASLAKMSVSNRTSFVTLIDTPYKLTLPENSTLVSSQEIVFDLTQYLNLELQGLIAVLHNSQVPLELKQNWWKKVRDVADEPLNEKERHRQAVNRAAAAYIEHLLRNSDKRTRYLDLWTEAVDSPDLVDLVAAGIQYRERQYVPCLEACDKIVPSNNSISAGLIRLQLQASLKSGDVDQSRRIATSMTSTGLLIADQIKMAKTLGELQLNEQAIDQLVAAQARAPLANLLDVMNAYHSLGEKNRAIEIAQEIVRKTASEASWEPTYFANQPNPRKNALDYLARNNALDLLKEEFKKQYETYPEFERSAIQLANVSAAAKDYTILYKLRTKYGRRTPNAANTSDPFGSNQKAMSVTEISALLKKNPKALSTLEPSIVHNLARADQFVRLQEEVMPYLDQTGWCRIYPTLIERLEAAQEPCVDVLIPRLVELYGFEVFSHGINRAHYRYLSAKSSPQGRKKILETLQNRFGKKPVQDAAAFSQFAWLDTKQGRYLTPVLLETMKNELEYFEALRSSVEKRYREAPDDALATELLVQFSIREQAWSRAQQIADTFDSSNDWYQIVQLADTISIHPQLTATAMKMLDGASLKIPMTNNSFVQLYAKVATQEKQFAKRDVLLTRFYTFLAKQLNGGQPDAEFAFSSLQHSIESGLPILLENSFFGECWDLLKTYERIFSKGRSPNVTSDWAGRTESLKTKIQAALTEGAAIDLLLQVTGNDQISRERLGRLLESDYQWMFEYPRKPTKPDFSCSLERIIKKLPLTSTNQQSDAISASLASKTTELAKNLVLTGQETLKSCLAKLRIAAHLDRGDLAEPLVAYLLESLQNKPEAISANKEVITYVADELLKSTNCRPSGEKLRHIVREEKPAPPAGR